MTDGLEERARELAEAFDTAHELIQEAKGADGPNGGFVTDHLDSAEHWLNVAQEIATAALSSPAVPQPNTIAAGQREAARDLMRRVYEVVHHDGGCKSIGGNGDADCTCDAVPVLRNLEVALGLQVGTRPAKRTMTLSLTEQEQDALSKLMAEHELSGRAIFRKALMLYQRDHERRKAGETVHWSGDKQRARDFAGPLAIQSPDAVVDERGTMSPEAYERAPKHHYWGAGEPDCPREIKAGNGELHTLRCKVCGLDDPRNPICHADQHFDASAIRDGVRS